MNSYRRIAAISATVAIIAAVLAAGGTLKSSAQKPAFSPAAVIDPAAEAARRKSLLNGLITDYIQSHPDAPVGWSKILIAAEPYINERLDKSNEPFRFDARNERFVDRK